MAREKRSERRMPVDIILNKYIHGEPHLCRALNLSRGGMLLRKIFEPDVPHHKVQLEFLLPGTSHVIRAEGMALMESPLARSVGVRFTSMSQESAALLERFLSGKLSMTEQVEAQRSNG